MRKILLIDDDEEVLSINKNISSERDSRSMPPPLL